MKNNDKKQQQHFVHKQEIFMRALKYGEIFILYQNDAFIHQWAENLPLFLKRKWHKACENNSLFPANICNTLLILQEKILKTKERQSVKLCLFDDEQKPLWYQFTLDCDFDEKGQVIGYVMTACNVSPLQECHENLISLQLEVNHRSKNLFAIIQSIANQTGQYSKTIPIFLTKFRGRIQSLANALDLVTERDKYGTALNRLIKAQIAQYYPTEMMPLKIIGENPNMVPDAVIYIGLALHELLMNSLAYGALYQKQHGSKIKNPITVDTYYDEDKDEGKGKGKGKSEGRNLTLCWTEKFDETMKLIPNLQAHFGRAILEKIVPTCLNGKATLQLDEYGVIYRLTINNNYFSM